MVVHHLVRCIVIVALANGAGVMAQRQQSLAINAARERARPAYDAGLRHLQQEEFDAAVKSFQEAIELDGTFDMAYYMLGRTHMVTKRYAAAVIALERCRELHLAESSTQLLNKQEIQSIRRRRLNELSERETELQAAISAGGRRDIDRLRAELSMIQERKRQLEDADRQLTSEQAVPSYVSLALGSAYFRSGKLPEAEKAYAATVAADPKVGEAYSNLAVVYMETARYDDAERAIRDAEKTGFKVAPALKDEIKKRRKAGSL